MTFAYDKEKENVLEHASMSMKQGEKVAIVGRSGAGKSTIIQLISRFYEADKGNVCIGGVNVKHINYEELLKHITPRSLATNFIASFCERPFPK